MSLDQKQSLVMSHQKSSKRVERRFCLMYTTSMLIMGLVVGICLSYTIVKQAFLSQLKTSDPVSSDHIRDSLFSHISAETIRRTLMQVFICQTTDRNEIFFD